MKCNKFEFAPRVSDRCFPGSQKKKNVYKLQNSSKVLFVIQSTNKAEEKTI